MMARTRTRTSAARMSAETPAVSVADGSHGTAFHPAEAPQRPGLVGRANRYAAKLGRLLQTGLKLLLLGLPWPVRRILLQAAFGYELHPTSWIGMSWVYPKRLVLKANARIGHLTLVKSLDALELGSNSSIGNLNWITAHPSGGVHFRHVPDRSPSLIIGEHSSITSHHFLDCASRIRIGDFTTIAGVHSQIFTHNLDVLRNRQDSRPVEIGSYCLVASGVVILAGSVLPDYSVLSAMSLLNKPHRDSHYLYAGVPAAAIKPLPADALYFSRASGFVE